MPEATGSREFFVAGGTLHLDAPSYVERPADHHLRAFVQAGELCYVLTTRQMGKSSLVARTAEYLDSLGVHTATIDLSDIGNASSEEWYLSLLDDLQSQLSLTTDAEIWWDENRSLSHVRRFTKYVQEILPAEIDGPVAVFIDEIDFVLNLDFTDDFFAAIRALFNRGRRYSENHQASFILVGVATPDDLIKDPGRTPFNVGEQIRLEEFTLADATVLLQGLPGQNQALLERIFYWTNGHPYLTQKIGRAIAQEGHSDWTSSAVDALVYDLFFTREAFFEDSNLRFVHRQITSGSDSPELLRLYKQIRRGRVKSVERSASQKDLILYGLVGHDEGGYLVVRNRIYDRVFDDGWIKENDPVTWWEALPRSIRIAVVSILFLAVAFAGATVVALRNAQSAEEGALLALSRQLIAQSTASVNAQYDLSLLLGLEALRILDTTETQGIVRYGLTANPYISAFLRTGDSPISVVSLSPGGRILAAGSENGEILIWDTENHGQLAPPLVGHHSNVSALAFAPDKKYLISGSCADSLEVSDICTDGRLAVWDLAADGELLKLVQVHDDQVRGIALNAVGDAFATGGGTSLIVWDMATLKPAWRRDFGGENRIVSLAFSPTNPDLLVYGDETGRIGVLNTATRTAILELDAHDDRVTNLAFSPDGQLLGSSGVDGTIALWDTNSWEPRGLSFIAHAGSVFDLEFHADRSFITAGADGRTIQWTISSDGRDEIQQEGDLVGHGGLVWSLSAADTVDGEIVATNGPDDSAILWSLVGDVARGRWLPGLQGKILGLAFSADGSVLASAGEDQTVRLWDVATRAPLGSPLKGHQDAVRRVVFQPEGNYLASGGRDNKVILWDLSDGQFTQQELVGHESYVRSVVFAPDGRTLASSDDFGTINLWDVETAVLVRTLTSTQRQREIFDIDYSPDGSVLAAGRYDGSVQLWDVITGLPLGDPIDTGIDQIWDVEFEPSGTVLAVSGAGETVPFIDVARREVRSRLLTNQANRIGALAFSPDGRFLATGSSDSTIVIWDMATRHAMGPPLTMHANEIYALRFSPDGRILASADLGGGVLMSVVEYDEPAQEVCAIVSRSLTEEEWSQYVGSGVDYEESCPEYAN